MADWRAAFAVEGTDFAVKDSAHPNGHRGADWKLGAGQVVPAFQKCRVIASNLFSSILGYCVTVQLIGGKYDGYYVGYAHLRGGTRPNNGDILQAGDQIGLVAAGEGFPIVSKTLATATSNYSGTSWNGPHIHMTLSNRIDGIFLGVINVAIFDPRPIVYANVSGVSGSSLNVTPVVVKKPLPKPPVIPVPEPPKKKDPILMHVLVSNVEANGVFGVITGAGNLINLTGNGPRKRFWEKVIADQRGIKIADVKPIEVSGEEWASFGL